jgi:hypothetical protein
MIRCGTYFPSFLFRVLNIIDASDKQISHHPANHVLVLQYSCSFGLNEPGFIREVKAQNRDILPDLRPFSLSAAMAPQVIRNVLESICCETTAFTL